MNATITDPSQGEPEKCHLLGPFAVLVQGALGALALLSLVYKRWRERPQRPIKIWAFDVSKQVFGSVLLHLANLFMSMLSAGEIEASIAKAAAASLAAAAEGDGNKKPIEQYMPNPCSFYLLNLAIDTTLGIPILLVILKVLTYGASLTPLARPPESIRSGNYGNPPRATWWLKQSVIYFIGLFGMKLCVLAIFELCPWIVIVGDWALKWTEGNTALQIAFVMLIFPLIMNAMQYYIIDTFIKNKGDGQHATDATSQDGSEGEQERFLGSDEEGHSSVEGDDSINQVKAPVKTNIEQLVPRYDPKKDGEAETLAGGSSGESTDSPRHRSRVQSPER